MVLDIRADARKIQDDINIRLLEEGRRANATPLENRRRVEGSRRQDNLEISGDSKDAIITQISDLDDWRMVETLFVKHSGYLMLDEKVII